MEAILDSGRGCQNLSIILWGGGAKMERRPTALVIAFEGGVRRGGGEVGERGSNHVLVLNTAMYMSFTLHLSFSYLRSDVAASRDIKKFRRERYTKRFFKIWISYS
jgi:hypothetical protein